MVIGRTVDGTVMISVLMKFCAMPGGASWLLTQTSS